MQYAYEMKCGDVSDVRIFFYVTVSIRVTVRVTVSVMVSVSVSVSVNVYAITTAVSLTFAYEKIYSVS